MTDKYRNDDAVILRHDGGGVLRLDPARFGDDARKAAKKEGWVEQEPQKDGFRKRRKRTAADMKRLIAEGIVADPATGGQPHQEYGPETFVFNVPLGTLGGETKPLDNGKE
ncbi:MAG: hypothetical protein H0W42_11170 [Gemmatimonadaceae bacterium]|nr:hypothetical protein [Gemmatimonadaceae bacterium]